MKEIKLMLKDKIQIAIITYNRKEYLRHTLDILLEEKSPVKEFDISVINNDSDDGTKELVDEYCKKYYNVTQIVNPINIGGNANIVKAYIEPYNKDYIWLLGDNDYYNWTS